MLEYMSLDMQAKSKHCGAHWKRKLLAKKEQKKLQSLVGSAILVYQSGEPI